MQIINFINGTLDYNKLLIILENITINYSGKRIIQNFNLQIKSNDKLALTGPSGSGKSTILSFIMGFTKADAGRVIIDGDPISFSNLRKMRSKMSWLPQNYEIIGNQTVLDTVMYPFSFSANKSRKPTHSRIIDCLERLNLSDDLLSKEFKNLSGGEKQRIGMIICKLLDTEIVLLDEPTSALDSESVDRAISFLLTDSEKIIVSATHDNQWLQSCSRVVSIANE